MKGTTKIHSIIIIVCMFLAPNVKKGFMKWANVTVENIQQKKEKKKLENVLICCVSEML